MQGLSPRVRGNHCGSNHISPIGRSIPACAGESTLVLELYSALWVYPRVCGGIHVFRPDILETDGLSPRVRGNP